MNRKKIISVLCLSLCIVFSFTGCFRSNTSGNTVDEPEITAEYLSGEYTEQLIRDGAIHHFGSISVSKDENGGCTARIRLKKLVNSPEHDKGYYLADKNVSMTVPCSPNARVTYLKKGQTAPRVITVDQLIEYTSENPQEENVYDIYEIGGSVELILAKELK